VRRVLLVDDDEHVLRSLSSALTRSGFSVTVSLDAGPALASTESYEIVVVDFHMKTATGADVVRHFKARSGGVFCVVLTGEIDDATIALCETAGADVTLAKPVSLTALRKLLAHAAA
jgi:CheY-like chemotaxis protein